MANQTFFPAVSGRNRNIYERIPKKPGVVRTQSTLRLESDALGTQSSVDFNLIKGSGNYTQHETEKRLSITDNFIVTEIGFYILKVTTAGTNRGDTLRTFPNAVQFSGSNEATNLMNLYNGYLGITIDGKQILAGQWDLMRHYRVGSAQKGVLTAASGTGNAWDQSTWDTASYGMFPVTPTITFYGSSNNLITLNLPAAVNMAGTSSTNYAVLLFRGYLDQSASNVVG